MKDSVLALDTEVEEGRVRTSYVNNLVRANAFGRRGGPHFKLGDTSLGWFGLYFTSGVESKLCRESVQYT